MKKILPVRTLYGNIFCSTIMLSLLITLSSAISLPAYSVVSQRTGDSIIVHKKITSKKHKIKLYPNASHQVLFFSVKGVNGKVYQLFLFNIEGRLVKQVNIKNKQTTVLNNIDKGNYLFEVFSDDERIENGQVIVL